MNKKSNKAAGTKPPQADEKPTTFNGDLGKIPAPLAHLTQQKIWVCWKWKRVKDKWTKPPFRADNPAVHASTSDPATWGSYETALKQVRAGKVDGLGFAVRGCDIGAFDLDHCRDPMTGKVAPWAQEYLDRFPTAYREATVSGKGLRILGTSDQQNLSPKFKLPQKGNGAAVELFSGSTHYLTLSCNEIGSCQALPPIGEQMKVIAAELGNGVRSKVQDEDDPRPATDAADGDASVELPWSFENELRLRSALSAIPTDEDLLRDELGHSHSVWVTVGRVIERLDWGKRRYAVFRDWSSQSEEFDETGLRSQWDSFRRNRNSYIISGKKPATILTIFFYARAFGWSDNTELKEFKITPKDKAGDKPAAKPKAGDKTDAKPSEGLFDPWAQYQVPEFPIDVLPHAAVREFVVAQGEVLGCGPSAMVMGALTTFSSALDHRFALKMMRNGNWYVSPRLWVLLYGDPSKLKTPLINAATEPLEAFQAEVQEVYKQELQLAELSGEKKPKKPEPPERYVVWDTTIEKLGEILARSGRGLLVKRDEFAGWISSMEKYGRGEGANRAFWLKAFDGGRGSVDRISRGEIFIDNLSVSLIGGIQPKRMAELHGLTSDGLLQRFIPHVMKEQKFALDRPCDTRAYSSLVRQLLRTSPQVLLLSDPALKVMDALRLHLHDLGRTTGGMADGFQAFVGKLPGMVGSLTLILHMLTDSGKVKPEVAPATVENVRRLVDDFILPHALEFYRCAESATDGDRLRKIASWILTNGKERFVVSDLTSNVVDFRGLTVFEVNERVSPLIATGWLLAAEPGNTCRAWKVNPNVFAQFAKRVKLEEARKAELAKLMKSPRKDKA
jgi:hypothetical protein